jgi:hypothetical protein
MFYNYKQKFMKGSKTIVQDLVMRRSTRIYIETENEYLKKIIDEETKEIDVFKIENRKKEKVLVVNKIKDKVTMKIRKSNCIF